MQDIRNFFRTKSDKEKTNNKPVKIEKKASRKRIFIDSDSDEETIKTPKRNVSQKTAKSSTKKTKEESSTPKYFEVDKNKVKSLFGTEPVKQRTGPPKVKDKKALIEDEIADISSSFLDMDDDGWVKEATTPMKSAEKPNVSQNCSSSKARDHSISPSCTPEKKSSFVNHQRSPSRSPKKPLPTKRNHDVSPSTPTRPSKQKSPKSSLASRSPASPSKFPLLDVQVKKVSPKSLEDKPKHSSDQSSILSNKPNSQKYSQIPQVLASSPKNSVFKKSPVEKPNNISSNKNLANSSPSETRNGVLTPTKPSKFYSTPVTSTSQKHGLPSSFPSEPKKMNAKFELWVEKYKPNSLKQIIGQQGEKSNVNKLVKWLKAWHSNHSGNKKISKPSPWAKDDSGAYFKAALLSGPPGIGKTTTAHLVCKELNMDAVEFNASDTRSKKLLHSEITELLSSKSLTPFAQGGAATSKNHVLIMDEVDGMAGNEDRGGIQELIALIKGSKVPIICMCNDRNHPKIRSLVNHCFDLRFSKPRADQIKGAMMSICFKEGLKIKPDILNSIITCTNQDIRLVLNHLSMLAAKHDSEMTVSSKELKLGAWDVLRKVFTENERRGMSIHDKLDLFFHDYSIAPLFVQENYLNVVPHADEAKDKKGKMRLFAQAASSLCNGDLIDKAIRSQNAWSLLPTQALFSSLVPGEVLEGHVGGMINFPSWLGKNSKKNKMDRLAQEIQSHTRLKASASNEAIRLDYAAALRNAILQPLIRNGSNGVDESLSFLREYSLLREDVESLNELSMWPGSKDLLSSVDSKVKAAFTRAYNKNPVLTPFSISSAGVKKSRAVQDNDGMDEIYDGDDGDIGGNDEDDNDDGEVDPATDGMILVKKKTKPETSKDTKKKNNSAGPSKPRGAGRGRSGKK